MSFTTKIVTVQTTATSILSLNSSQKKRMIKNIGDNTIFIGSDDSVTTSNGYPLDVLESINISDYHGEVYGISEADTEVTVFEDE